MSLSPRLTLVPPRERHRGKVSMFDYRHRALIQQARLGRICVYAAMILRARMPLVGVRDSLSFAVRGGGTVCAARGTIRVHVTGAE